MSDEIHPHYGPCDHFGPHGECTECERLRFRLDPEAWQAWLRGGADVAPDGRTHYDGCWRESGHHACAVALIDQLATPERIAVLRRTAMLAIQSVRSDEDERCADQTFAVAELLDRAHREGR